MTNIYIKPILKSYNEYDLLNLIGPGHSASGYVNIQGAQAYNTQSVHKEEPATMLVQLKDLKDKDSILA